MTREHRQAYMEGFGRAMLLEEYVEEDDFGGKSRHDFIEEGKKVGGADATTEKAHGAPHTPNITATWPIAGPYDGWQGKAWVAGYRQGYLSQLRTMYGPLPSDPRYERTLVSDFGASRPSRYIPSERNALWWGRRGMEPPWESGFGDDVVPHLCETQWAESDARCIQHLGDPTFGDWED